MINWDVSKEEFEIINKIVKRALPIYQNANVDMDHMSLKMDITATHLNGCPLKLQALLDADDFSFVHDVSGIVNYINRNTGKLENCFLPRYAV